MDIYCGNLAYATTDDGLKAAFAAYGEVTSARVVKDRMTERSKGFGFVEMPNDAEAQAAIDALNECRERTERSEEFAGLKIAVGVMRALPSAQPGTGHWISARDEDGWHTWLVCSECGAKETNMKAKYCPMCGRKMV